MSIHLEQRVKALEDRMKDVDEASAKALTEVVRDACLQVGKLTNRVQRLEEKVRG